MSTIDVRYNALTVACECDWCGKSFVADSWDDVELCGDCLEELEKERTAAEAREAMEAELEFNEVHGIK